MSEGIAIVAFGDDCALPWLRFLKRGFRHCFVAVNDGACWLILDPMAQQMQLRFAPVAPDFDLAGFYRGQGYRILLLPLTAAPARAMPLAPFTCVEAVKRVLGLRARGIFTPYQLYRRLQRGGARER